MAVKFFAFLILLSYGAAMETPSSEFGAADLVALGVFSVPGPTSGAKSSVTKPLSSFGTSTAAAKSTGSAISSGSASAERQQALLIATAKLSDGSAHPSVPFLTVDMTQPSPGCGPFDWIFVASCSPPKLNERINPIIMDGMNKTPLPNSFLYVYKVPFEAENIRVTLPNYDSCGLDGDNSRTGDLKMGTPDRICNRAPFRRRSCRRRLIFFRRCSLRDCSTLVFKTRLIIFDGGSETVPYVASGSGFEICPTSSVNNLFLARR